jgi:hypothetical protein
VIHVKTAILYSGHSYHYEFINNEKFMPFYNDYIYILDLSKIDLTPYDMIIIPARTNQEVLYEYKDKFLHFLNEGKWLISLGEVYRPWLPNTGWEFCKTNFSWWIKEGGELPLIAPDPGHSLFNYITIDDARWHYHGTFWPPEGARIVLTNEKGGAIIYEDDVSFKGRLIATTLDPTYHIGARFIPQTEAFLYGFLRWIQDEYKKNLTTI